MNCLAALSSCLGPVSSLRFLESWLKLKSEWAYHHIRGSSRPDANTWFSLPEDPFYSGKEWPRSVGTMDMWWLFWTMLCSLPFGSAIKRHINTPFKKYCKSILPRFQTRRGSDRILTKPLRKWLTSHFQSSESIFCVRISALLRPPFWKHEPYLVF